MPGGLIALALGGFGIGLTEFLIAGLLPQVASSFAVSEAAAGRLNPGYALSVAVGAIALTAVTARLPRKQVLARGWWPCSSSATCCPRSHRTSR
jgi:DHA1 family inner membrane transport protein